MTKIKRYKDLAPTAMTTTRLIRRYSITCETKHVAATVTLRGLSNRRIVAFSFFALQVSRSELRMFFINDIGVIKNEKKRKKNKQTKTSTSRLLLFCVFIFCCMFCSVLFLSKGFVSIIDR